MGFESFMVHCDKIVKPYDFRVKYYQTNGSTIGGLITILMFTFFIFYFITLYI